MFIVRRAALKMFDGQSSIEMVSSIRSKNWRVVTPMLSLPLIYSYCSCALVMDDRLQESMLRCGALSTDNVCYSRMYFNIKFLSLSDMPFWYYRRIDYKSKPEYKLSID